MNPSKNIPDTFFETASPQTASRAPKPELGGIFSNAARAKEVLSTRKDQQPTQEK